MPPITPNLVTLFAATALSIASVESAHAFNPQPEPPERAKNHVRISKPLKQLVRPHLPNGARMYPDTKPAGSGKLSPGNGVLIQSATGAAQVQVEAKQI